VRTLTGDIFEALLAQLDSNRTLAGERYEALRHRLIRYFEWNLCASAPDLADEAITRLAIKCQQHRIANVETYAIGIARNVRHEAQKVAPLAEFRPELATGATTTGPNQEDGLRAAEADRLRVCVKRCLDALGPRDRDVFVRFFVIDDNHAEHRRGLAKSLGISDGALRTRACRWRARLNRCVMNCQNGNSL
jgi:DNA-directed RNA polymerase specialized sigma24 family protein